VTAFNLRALRLRPGEQFVQTLPVELEALELGGQRYDPVPAKPEGALTITRMASGTLFELSLEVQLEGPCFRCLGEAGVPIRIAAREYQAESPDSEELRTPYLSDGRLELSQWARDAVALALPEKILCREECAGLCPGCGADRNSETCQCGPEEPDSRWAKLAELKERLEA
jgi:uncharacterized protein